MRKLLLTLAVMLPVASAQAAETVYAPAPDEDATGFSLAQTPVTEPDIFGTGRSFGAGTAYHFGNGFSAQFDNLNSYTDRSGLSQGFGGVNSNAFMLRGLYEYDGGSWRLKPFIGAGLGMVDTTASLLGEQSNDWVTAYNVRGGVNYAISQKLMGSVGYSWTNGEKPHLTLRGIPAQLKFPAGGVFLGFNYKLR